MSRPSKMIRPAGRLEQPHDAAGQRRLAAARLADDAERLALAARVKRDAVDRLHRRDLLLEDDPARDREVLLEVLDDEELVAVVPPPSRAPQLVTTGLGQRPRAASRPRGPSSPRRGGRPARCSGRRGTGELRLRRAADVHHVRAARMEPAAARRVQQRRRLARDLDEALDVGVEPRQRAQQAPGVRVLRPLEELVDRSPPRRPAPAYMTTTSSAISATTPRSCVIMMIAVPNSLLELAASAPGSAPASSRRARSSARRRSAGRGR